MERLEAEKRLLQEKLDQPVSAPMSPRSLPMLVSGASQPPGGPLIGGTAATLSLGLGLGSSEQATNLTEHIINLRREVSRLKANLEKTERDHKENIAKIVKEEKTIREENVRLQRRLQMEVDRREALCRHLSESESSLEMDDERHFNESSRVRTISSPVPGYAVTQSAAVATNNSSAANSGSAAPAAQAQTATSSTASIMMFSQPSSQQQQLSERCPACNQLKPVGLNTSNTLFSSTSPPPSLPMNVGTGRQMSQGGGGSGFNALTASSSLSSSSSSINSANFNKMPLLVQSNVTNSVTTGLNSSTAVTSSMEVGGKK